MNKCKNKLSKRQQFIQECIEDPKKTADKILSISNGIRNCRTSSDVVFALSELLFLSTRTIERDAFERTYDTTTPQA